MYANKLSYCGKFVVKQLEEKENLKKSKKMTQSKKGKNVENKKGECERRGNRSESNV